MAKGTQTVDFGATPVAEAVFNFTDAALIGLTYVEAFMMADDSTGDNDADQHRAAAALLRLAGGTPNGSGNVNVYADALDGYFFGTYKMRWAAN